MDEKAFSESMDGKHKNLRVHLVNPPDKEPWIKHADYIADQKRLKISMWCTIIASVSSIMLLLQPVRLYI